MVPVVCCWFFDFVALFIFEIRESEECRALFLTRNEAVMLVVGVLFPEVQLVFSRARGRCCLGRVLPRCPSGWNCCAGRVRLWICCFLQVSATESRRGKALFSVGISALVGLELMHVRKYLLVSVTLSYLEVLLLDIIS